MKFHFEPNLKFQLNAINTVVRLFDGAPYVAAEDRLFSGVSANRLLLDPKTVLANRDRIAKENNLTDISPSEDMDFSIEMETGTGKTYVYLRTILELNKEYGLSKFIILVPSIAVKEGVIKTLEITKDHFKELYNTNYRYFAFDSSKPNAILHYSQSSSLEIMVMNIQAFNADDRIINQERDANNGEPLIKLLEATSPIVIMDEPQEGMDTENMQGRFKVLNPLIKLRYSATHRVVKNLIYQLTPFDAYNDHLVKTIEVLGIHEDNRQSNIAVELKEVKFSDKGKAPQAKLAVSVRLVGGDFKEKTITADAGDDLEEKTNNPVYHGWVVERVWKDLGDGEAKIKFSNGIELKTGKRHGWEKETVFQEQIRWAVKKHFEKKEYLKPLNIKVLSLFFIDRVANYVDGDGLIRRLFTKIYAEEYRAKYGSKPENIAAVHNGYFAKTGKGEYTDNENAMSKNSEVFELIMKDKERLLSFSEPLEFIFSHSALGVGWDNPNVFNICTLNETESAIQKRQEIGRGLRICVDQDGNRVRDPEDKEVLNPINLLTVIPNQSYYSFVQGYQSELIAAYGEAGKTQKLRDARGKPTTVRRNKDKFDSVEFSELWKRISKKTTYTVHFNEQAIVEKCVASLNTIIVPEHAIKIELNRIKTLKADEGISQRHIGSEEVVAQTSNVNLNIVEHLAEETYLPVGTTQTILESIKNKERIVKNPLVFLTEAAKRIKAVLEQEMVRMVSYESLNERYGKEQFDKLFETYKQTVKVNNSIYDQIPYDSETVEKLFAESADAENHINLFIKLPDWYAIDTPIGKYHPDWALVIEKKTLNLDAETGEAKEDAEYYFVVETKGTKDIAKLKPDERTKIECAIKHFEAIGLKEYLAPIDTIETFKLRASEQAGQHIF